ncbi:hypothetical protein BKA62DRAFT_690990 [Auriculariales sp. MPI-PUGE-AT-0066]|nr:hypothetical protein BKA62DRAFT_690990 [Auriculariales sp. MPI-PUGE-AT-0066]
MAVGSPMDGGHAQSAQSSAPAHSDGAQAPGTPQDEDAPQRQLNVNDALTYLDAVKTQFSDQPDVYNKFLDIMKEFKTEQLTTPGVIERVSSLFRGHPSLIQGFNTFLPQGYSIECSTDPRNASTIVVTTPDGTRTSQIQHPHPQHPPPATQLPERVVDLPPAPSPVPPFLPSNATHLQSGPPPGSPGASGHANVLTGMRAGPSAGSNAPPPVPKDTKPAQQAEFHHAIAFINKIKARYQNDPDVYKSFLEILQNYQAKAQKGENASTQIYQQVRRLLASTPDLMDEFKAFLPEVAGEAAGWDSKQDKQPRRKPGAPGSGAAGPSGAAAPNAPQKRKKRTDKEDQTRPSPQKKSKHTHTKESSPPYQSDQRAAAPAPIPPRSQPLPPLQMGAIMAQQQQLNHPVSTQSDLQFFDTLKRNFSDRSTYDEFLKLLNLFSKDIIGARTLVDRARSFLGDSTELMEQFKDIIGYTDADARPRPNAPPAVAERVRAVEDCGPSYRRLPPDQVALACSGRDELARSVLNDEWVSHPTWMSEDSVFQSHKKNQFEEALHRSEEERHEYDFHIEALGRTISLLEPVFQKVLRMGDAERVAYKLPAGLGASSPSIHLRIMKKIYGREAGQEVALALQESPGIAVPVVLPRLKQKDEEWRRARREWNKVWREIDVRNFYKSLDHQGITFKQNDKKTTTAKHLVQQIEAARAEAPRGSTARSGSHLTFKITDEDVLKDAMKLVFSFLDRASTGAGVLGVMYSPREARRVERLLREIVPTFMMVDIAEFDKTFGPAPEGEEVIVSTRSAPQEDDMDLDTPSSKRPNESAADTPETSHGEEVAAQDLRKRLLTVQHQGKPTEGDTEASTTAPTDADTTVTPSTSNLSNLTASGGSSKKQKRKSTVAPTASRPARKRVGDDIWVRHRPDQSLSAAAAKGGVSASVIVGADGEVNGADTNSPRTMRSGKANSQTDEEVSPTNEVSKRTTPSGKLPFFGNTTYYSLFRLLQVLYSRLNSCKMFADGLARDSKVSHSANPIAVELGLNDPIYGIVGSLVSSTAAAQFAAATTTSGKGRSRPVSRAQTPLPAVVAPAIFPAADVMSVDEVPSSDTAAITGAQDVKPEEVKGNAAQYFYAHLLESCEKLFEGDLEPLAFEENLRFMFGTQAYVMFTVDKVVGAIVKQLQTALQDSKCTELLQLLRREREREREIRKRHEQEGSPAAGTGPAMRIATSLARERDLQDQVRYRRDVETLIGSDEHLFKMVWAVSEKTLSFQLTKKADKSFTNGDGGSAPDPPNALERWMQYTASYVMDTPTEDETLRQTLLESSALTNGPTNVNGNGNGNSGSGGAEGEENSSVSSGGEGIETRIRPPFLKRTLVQDKAPRRKDGYGVEVRFCLATYKMFYVADKGDAAWVVRSAGDIRAAGDRVKARAEICRFLNN